ncbi:hypothetical protein JZ751_009736 [Albula glossodonta]|uniref:Uncharacterized protein n=1 Tax=Albula glossodonta TaxID=121402 RepID=A0A8T2NW53_9TELE|nr:hypothetical protein JZ751_009736 [Albula glossodonta]
MEHSLNMPTAAHPANVSTRHILSWSSGIQMFPQVQKPSHEVEAHLRTSSFPPGDDIIRPPFASVSSWPNFSPYCISGPVPVSRLSLHADSLTADRNFCSSDLLIAGCSAHSRCNETQAFDIPRGEATLEQLQP